MSINVAMSERWEMEWRWYAVVALRFQVKVAVSPTICRQEMCQPKLGAAL